MFQHLTHRISNFTLDNGTSEILKRQAIKHAFIYSGPMFSIETNEKFTALRSEAPCL